MHDASTGQARGLLVGKLVSQGSARSRSDDSVDVLVPQRLRARRVRLDPPDLGSGLRTRPVGSAQRRAMSRHGANDNVMTTLFGGYESTATALTWVWALLSQHPEVAERIKAEVDQVIGSGELTADVVEQLAYTDMVVNEALRLYPPFWGWFRTAYNDDVIDGVRIPAGRRSSCAPMRPSEIRESGPIRTPSTQSASARRHATVLRTTRSRWGRAHASGSRSRSSR